VKYSSTNRIVPSDSRPAAQQHKTSSRNEVPNIRISVFCTYVSWCSSCRILRISVLFLTRRKMDTGARKCVCSRTNRFVHNVEFTEGLLL